MHCRLLLAPHADALSLRWQDKHVKMYFPWAAEVAPAGPRDSRAHGGWAQHGLQLLGPEQVAARVCTHTRKRLIVGNFAYIKHVLVAMKDGILPEVCIPVS